MGEGIRRKLCMLLAAAVLTLGLWTPIPVQSAQTGVTVTTPEAFMAALAQRKSPIIVDDLITIGNQADTDKRMIPVKIPGGTVIEGTSRGMLNCRAPVQLEGDSVVFRNIEMVFESSNALGSVPHREIFLAGHSLTIDNVKTYLAGGDNSFGDLGGTEAELLPTVYAGGYTGTVNGKNASLTVVNSNDKTMFQGIYMGHGEGTDRKSPYQGSAQLKLDEKVIVRDSIDVSENSRAEIEITGAQSDTIAKAKTYLGNENTTLTLSQGILKDVSVERVGNLVIDNGGCLGTVTGALQNVVLKNGGGLDVTKASNAVIAGNFTGVSAPSEDQGFLILNKTGTLEIQGTVSGVTKFQTDYRLFPGVMYVGRQYIKADPAKAVRGNFVLTEKSLENGYRLNYREGAWIPCWEEDYEEPSEEEKPPVTPPEEKPEITPPVTPPEEEKPEIPPPVTPPEEEKPEITPPVTPPEEEKPEITPPVTPPEGEKPPVTPEEEPPSVTPPVTLPEEEKPESTPPVHVHRYVPVFEKATLEKDGARMKKCSCGKISEQQSIYRIQDVKLSSERMVYSGRSREPGLKVIDRAGRTVDRSQYQVSYQNNVKVGQGKVIVRFRGNYSGSLEKNFLIEPEQTSLTKLKAKSKGFTVRWRKQAVQTAGYEIQYSTSSRFTKKNTRTITVKNKKTTSKTISKQKPGKKYYVRIRTYQTAKVDGRTVRIYSKWSKAKSVKTKK